MVTSSIKLKALIGISSQFNNMNLYKNKIHVVADAGDARLRQLQKSLDVWQQRLDTNPNDKKIQAMVKVRQDAINELLAKSPNSTTEIKGENMTLKELKQEAAELTEEVPTIKNAQDLYKYAKSLNLSIEGKNGKPLGTDAIKGMIAQVLWSKEHPNEEMPPQIAPMLIKDITGEGKEFVDKTFTKDKVVLQHKINGQRFILCLEPNGQTHMTSRDRSVKTFRYSELDDHVLGLLNLKSPFKGRTVLDGEILCDNPNIKLPSGITTTSTLQSTVALMHMNSKEALEFQRKNNFSLRYKVFDILMLDGKNVEKEPYDVRKELTVTACTKIKELNPNCSIDVLPTIEDFESAWDEFEKYVSEGGEGLIVKYRDAPYEQGKRSKGQWKLKGRLTIDGFITGYVKSSEDKAFKDFIGGLVFSTNYHGKQIEIAAVSNIDLATRKAATVYKDGAPILNPDWYGKCAELVAQNFKEGSMRLGSARIGEWRDDKNPEDCVLQDEMIRYDR